MNERMIEIAKEAGLDLSWEGWTSPTPNNKYPECVTEEALQHFYELVVADERKKYESLIRQMEDAKTLSSDPTPLLNEAFKNRLAQAIEQMPFGDTAASFAQFVREFK